MRLVYLALAGFITALSAFTLTLAAYVQHFITCIKHEAVVLLVLGAIVFPIGVMHGWGIWLGIFTR